MRQNTDAGVLTRYTGAKNLQNMLRAHRIVFSVDHYSLEGMSKKLLDTIVLCEPITRKENLQQLMGRALRIHEAKQEPLFITLFDKFEEHQRALQRMRRILLQWPHEENGPITPTIVEAV